MAKRAQIMWSIWNLTVGRKSDRHWRLDELPKVFVRRANDLLSAVSGSRRQTARDSAASIMTTAWLTQPSWRLASI